jgi:hypothetical protein
MALTTTAGRTPGRAAARVPPGGQQQRRVGPQGRPGGAARSPGRLTGDNDDRRGGEQP